MMTENKLYEKRKEEKNVKSQVIPLSEVEKQKVFLQDLRMEQDEGPR